ncbi:hypothetical protein RI367_003001 [Sorochytrium milnesiophthora]
MPPPQEQQQTVVVIMGVSGTGKSTVLTSLRDHYSKDGETAMLEGDDFHPAANIQKMSAGMPLTDDDRWPWLEATCRGVHDALRTSGLVLLACSALKQTYRQYIADRVVRDGVKLVFLYLRASLDKLTERMKHRQGHYMKVQMLQSQMATLEPPIANESDKYCTLTLDTDELTPQETGMAAAPMEMRLREDVYAHPQFTVTIGAPMHDSEAVPVSRAEYLRGADGIRYMCVMPAVSPQPSLDDATFPAASSADKRNALAKKLTPLEEEERTIRLAMEALEPLRSKTVCLKTRFSWWAYEYCHLYTVRQMHEGNDNLQAEYILGNYSPSTKPSIRTSSGRKTLALRYDQGTICDVTGRPRFVDVLFYCNPNHQDHVSSAYEVNTCQYEVVVSTPRLCSETIFDYQGTMPQHPITCHPLLNDTAFAAYKAGKNVPVYPPPNKLTLSMPGKGVQAAARKNEKPLLGQVVADVALAVLKRLKGSNAEGSDADTPEQGEGDADAGEEPGIKLFFVTQDEDDNVRLEPVSSDTNAASSDTDAAAPAAPAAPAVNKRDTPKADDNARSKASVPGKKSVLNINDDNQDRDKQQQDTRKAKQPPSRKQEL